jgi:hypothetical protein
MVFLNSVAVSGISFLLTSKKNVLKGFLEQAVGLEHHVTVVGCWDIRNMKSGRNEMI